MDAKEKEVSVETDSVMLSQLVKNSEKQLFYTRIMALAAVVIAAAILICVMVLVPKVTKTISEVNEVIAQATDTITLADTAIESVTEMSKSITDMGSHMDTFITENSETVAEVMEKLESIDFEGLNRAIKDLGDVVEPVADFFGKFK